MLKVVFGSAKPTAEHQGEPSHRVDSCKTDASDASSVENPRVLARTVNPDAQSSHRFDVERVILHRFDPYGTY